MQPALPNPLLKRIFRNKITRLLIGPQANSRGSLRTHELGASEDALAVSQPNRMCDSLFYVIDIGSTGRDRVMAGG